MAFLPLPTILEGWLPPNRANWELIVWSWQFFPIFTSIQWITTFFPQGKTSIQSRLNLNGHVAWALMEVPGVLCAWYCFLTIPPALGDLSASTTNTPAFKIPTLHPWLDIPSTWSDYGRSALPPSMSSWDVPVGNKTLLGLYTIHYIYRAILCPIINPSMSPIHPIVFVAASVWQMANGLSIGGWIAGYGKSSVNEWSGRSMSTTIGMVIWGWAWLGNMFHDDELREIRREAARRQRNGESKAQTDGRKVDNATTNGGSQRTTQTKSNEAEKKRKVDVSKVYVLPQNGLFHLILYPHYLCEWIEWGGFWMVGGLDFMPGRIFLVNEISTMLPRALGGWHWYVQRFGRERIGRRKAIVPFLL